MTSFRTKIIIIDDEQDLCFLLSNMLRNYGFEVDFFNTLQSGLTGVESLKPEWVIIDNNLPDGLGWEHTREILTSSPGVQVINISANPDSHRNFTDPQVHYLIKPIDVNSIVSLIRRQN
jgi:two-component system, OmpR family, response regulator